MGRVGYVVAADEVVAAVAPQALQERRVLPPADAFRSIREEARASTHLASPDRSKRASASSDGTV